MRTNLIILSLLTACNQSAQPTGDPISRQASEHHLTLEKPVHNIRASYPWEERYRNTYPLITKEYFRCKGNPRHPIETARNSRGDPICLTDCAGIDQHSLPLRDDKEYIYPILITLLNHLQQTHNTRAIITCGHRCPAHNSYSDRTQSAATSKHLIAAEVDFYLQNLEDKPYQVVETLLDYYKDDPNYSTFTRNNNTWTNKEIQIRLHPKNEPRDLDNQHPYPYITIEVRYDRERKQRVYYTWQRAHNGYMRW